MSFYEFVRDDRLYVKSDVLEGIKHGFTSRLGGVSHGKVYGFNFGFRVGDDESAVYENYRLMAGDMKIDLSKAVLSRQTHTDNIRIVTESDHGKGICRESDIFDTDGLVTDVKGTSLIVFSADCNPILLWDRKKNVISAVHSGWRGTVKHISQKAVGIMVSHFNCSASDIVAAVGPSIGPCCFEFGSEAVALFDEKYIAKAENDKYKVDLWSIIYDDLWQSGLLSENIDISRICTVCQSDRYYSYRTQKEKTGRQIAVITL